MIASPAFWQPARVVVDPTLPDLPRGVSLGVVTDGVFAGRLVLSNNAGSVGPSDTKLVRHAMVLLAWSIYADQRNGVVRSACHPARRIHT